MLGLYSLWARIAAESKWRMLATFVLAWNTPVAGWHAVDFGHSPGTANAAPIIQARGPILELRQHIRCAHVTSIDGLASSSSLEAGGNTEHKEAMDIVVKTLKTDISRILRKEPTWEIFGEDFTVIGPSGSKVESLRLNRLFVHLLRRLRKKQALKDKVQVELKPVSDLSKNLIVAEWQVQLGRGRCPVRFWRREAAFCIDAETVFHLNGINKVDYLKINKWLVNGWELRSWPEVDLSSSFAENMQKIEEWTQEIRTLSEMAPLPRDRQGVRIGRFWTRMLDVVLDKVVDRLLDRILFRVGKEDLDRVVDRVIDRVLDRASDRALDQVGAVPLLDQVWARRRASPRSLDGRDGLQADLPSILSREPNWEYIASDFKLIDQTDFSLNVGLPPTKILLYLARQLKRGIAGSPLNDQFAIDTEKTFRPGTDGVPEPVLIARWLLEISLDEEYAGLDIEKLREEYLPFFPKGYGFPITIAGIFVFTFNENREVNSMKVDSWYINGQELRLKSDFPFLEVRQVY